MALTDTANLVLLQSSSPFVFCDKVCLDDRTVHQARSKKVARLTRCLWRRQKRRQRMR